MKNEAIPTRYYKSDPCYRIYESSGYLGFLCSGFMQKPGVSVDAKDRYYPFYTVVYVLRGRGTYVDENGREYPVTAGCLFQRNPYKKHSLFIDPDSQWAECYAGMSNSLVAEDQRKHMIMSSGIWEEPEQNTGLKDFTINILKIANVIDLNQPVFYPGVKLDYVKEFDSLLGVMKDANGAELVSLQLAIINLLNMIMRRQQQPDKSEDDWLDLACQLIAEAPGGWTPLPELLSKIPLSYSRIRFLFKEKMNISPGKYRIQRRIEEACNLLAIYKKTPKEVASNLGYNDYFAFSNQFKQIMGISPKSFCKQY